MGKFSHPKTVYTPHYIIKDILKEYYTTLTYMKAWTEKEKANELIKVQPSDSYYKILLIYVCI